MDTISDLAVLVRRLILALRKSDPSNRLTDVAQDYLRSQGLAGKTTRQNMLRPYTVSWEIALSLAEAYEGDRVVAAINSMDCDPLYASALLNIHARTLK